MFKKITKPSIAAKTKASRIINALEAMRLNAIAIGPRDLSAGSNFLLTSFSNTQLLSANLLYKETKAPVFDRYTISDMGNKKIGIIGLTENHKELLDNFAFADTQETLSEVLSLIQHKCDFIILLSNLSIQNNKEIAKEFTDIQLIISADKSKGTIRPFSINNTIITQTISRGKHLGFFQLELGLDKIWSKNFKGSIKTINDKLVHIELQIKRANSLNSKRPQDKQIPMEKLIHLKKELGAQVVLLEEEQTTSINNGFDSSFDYSFHKLNQNIKEKEAIKKLLQNK